eukprot:gene26221-31676_t
MALKNLRHLLKALKQSVSTALPFMSSLRLALKLSLAELKPGETVPTPTSAGIEPAMDKLPTRKRKDSGSFERPVKRRGRRSNSGNYDDENRDEDEDEMEGSVDGSNLGGGRSVSSSASLLAAQAPAPSGAASVSSFELDAAAEDKEEEAEAGDTEEVDRIESVDDDRDLAASPAQPDALANPEEEEEGSAGIAAADDDGDGDGDGADGDAEGEVVAKKPRKK